MKKSKRLALMLKYRELVAGGKLEHAWTILQLLRKHVITLGYSDVSNDVEIICEKMGCHIVYRGRYYIAYVYDWGK
jgi:hypothetical protein